MTQTHGEQVILTTKRCHHCGEMGELVVAQQSIDMRNAGAYVQDAFPYLSAPEREQIISGTHPQCWDEMFSEVESYDYQDYEHDGDE